jgi:hypothetical protein
MKKILFCSKTNSLKQIACKISLQDDQFSSVILPVTSKYLYEKGWNLLQVEECLGRIVARDKSYRYDEPCYLNALIAQVLNGITKRVEFGQHTKIDLFGRSAITNSKFDTRSNLRR